MKVYGNLNFKNEDQKFDVNVHKKKYIDSKLIERALKQKQEPLTEPTFRKLYLLESQQN